MRYIAGIAKVEKIEQKGPEKTAIANLDGEMIEARVAYNDYYSDVYPQSDWIREGMEVETRYTAGCGYSLHQRISECLKGTSGWQSNSKFFFWDWKQFEGCGS